jgi:hypothetical protein
VGPTAVPEFGVHRYARDASGFLSAQVARLEGGGMNYALWLWETGSDSLNYDHMNYRRGTNAKVHYDVNPNVDALTKTIRAAWARNTYRPPAP